MTPWVRATLSVAVLLLVGCESIFGPDSAVPFSPPPRFRQIVERTDRCLWTTYRVQGRHFSRLHWLHAEDLGTHPNGRPVLGEYWGDGQIALLNGPDASPYLVSHERIHEATAAGHEHPAFGEGPGWDPGNEAECEQPSVQKDGEWVGFGEDA